MAHTVVRRTREIGIRIALGALPSAVLRRTLQHALVLCSTGISIGVLAAWLLAPTIAGFVYGLSPRDPVTLFATIVVLLVTALLAAYVPARRAAKVDPIRALRTE
ncbi:MAG: FtsX-like permease family protein [Vicinamibacterales bacterium]